MGNWVSSQQPDTYHQCDCAYSPTPSTGGKIHTEMRKLILNVKVVTMELLKVEYSLYFHLLSSSPAATLGSLCRWHPTDSAPSSSLLPTRRYCSVEWLWLWSTGRTRLIVILKGFVYLLPISQDCNNLTYISSLQTIRGQNCAVAFHMYFHLIYPRPHNCICISIFNVQYTQVTTLADNIPIINIVFCTTKKLEKDIFQCPESLHS